MKSGVAGMRVSPSLLYPRTRIPRDVCFPARSYIPNTFCSTSHSDIVPRLFCFPTSVEQIQYMVSYCMRRFLGKKSPLKTHRNKKSSYCPIDSKNRSNFPTYSNFRSILNDRIFNYRNHSIAI